MPSLSFSLCTPLRRFSLTARVLSFCFLSKVAVVVSPPLSGCSSPHTDHQGGWRMEDGGWRMGGGEGNASSNEGKLPVRDPAPRRAMASVEAFRESANTNMRLCSRVVGRARGPAAKPSSLSSPPPFASAVSLFLPLSSLLSRLPSLLQPNSLPFSLPHVLPLPLLPPLLGFTHS